MQHANAMLKRIDQDGQLYSLYPNVTFTFGYKKLISRWDSERELSLRQHRARTTKYNRLVHKFRHRSTGLCIRTQVYQIQWNNAM